MSKRSAAYYITLACAVLCGFVAVAAPPPWWVPPPGTTWQIQLDGDAIDTSFDVQMYDIDLFDAADRFLGVVDTLHGDGRIVICYFSAGSFENWRPDKDSFPKAVKGNALDGWPGEKWLDIRNLAVLGPIMEARLDLAVTIGCDGVDPDNVNGYQNDTGFPLSAADQLAYNTWLAAEAHERNLSVGLKNDLEQIPDLVDDFDWMLNEQCYHYDECDTLLPFILAGKAVFGIEYLEEGGDPRDYCQDAVAAQFSWLVKTFDLRESPPNPCGDYLPVVDVQPIDDGIVGTTQDFLWSRHEAGVEYRLTWTRLSNGKKRDSDWLGEVALCPSTCSFEPGTLKPGAYTLKIKTRWPGAVKKPNSGKISFTVVP